MDSVLVDNICVGNTIPFCASGPEVMAYALHEADLIGKDTLIDNQPARELLKLFFEKRERFRENSRLGQLMVNEFGASREDLVSALSHHELKGVPLGQAFVDLNICSQETLEKALSRQVLVRKQLR